MTASRPSAPPRADASPSRLWPGALGLFLLALALYAAGAASEFATDDSAEFQRLAPRMERLHPPGYPLLMTIGGAARGILGGNAAPLAMTLSSSLFAALAVALLYWTLAVATRSKLGALVGALALAVSHTFWMHGGLSEAYALNALALVALFALFAASERRPGFAGRALLASAWITGVAAGNHLTIALFAPAFGLAYVAKFRAARRPAILVGATLLGLAGGACAPLFLALRFATLNDPVLQADGRSPFAFAWWWTMGGSSRTHLFAFGAGALAKRLALFVGYLCYQFASPAIALIAAGKLSMLGERRFAWFGLLAGVFLINLLYALNFDSSDVYVFYVPCHVVGAAMAGFGAAAVERHWRERFAKRAWRVGLVASVALLPPIAYVATPRVLDLAGVSLSRNKGNLYYLWPPKSAILAPWNAQAEALAKAAPEGSLILVNWSSYHLVAAWLEREGKLEKVRLLNQERDGTPWGEANWAATIHAELMANPDAMIVALGEAPGLRGDALYRVAASPAGVVAYELATNPSAAKSRAFSEAFDAALRGALARRGLPPMARPFYDASGALNPLD